MQFDGPGAVASTVGTFTIGWGPASSPMLVDGALVIPLDGYIDSYLAAFDQRTGKQRWRADRDPMAHNYSTPILRTSSDGACEIVVLVANGVIVTTMSMETGEVTKMGRIPGALGDCYASPVAADGKLFVVSEEGKSAVLRCGAQWDTLSVNDLGEQCYATPALGRGRVFVRTTDSLFCFGAR